MRAGLIIGGLFLMFVGILLFITIIFIPFAILCGLIGFAMLIVGLFTSSNTVPRQQIVYGSPPSHYQAQTAPVRYLILCPNCRNRVDSDVNFCPKCGADLRPKAVS